MGALLEFFHKLVPNPPPEHGYGLPTAPEFKPAWGTAGKGSKGGGPLTPMNMRPKEQIS